MDEEYYIALAKVRMERSWELLDEAETLLKQNAYKSANNRAFYAIEKSLKALLATARIDVATHNGGLKQFNYYFIFKGDGTFTSEDYKIIARSEQIRNASDYDDFYVADKAETRQQVENARKLVEKIRQYMENHFEIQRTEK